MSNFLRTLESRYKVTAKFGGSARDLRVNLMKDKLKEQGYGIERVQDDWWLTRGERRYLRLGLKGHAKMTDVLEKALRIVQPKDLAASAAPTPQQLAALTEYAEQKGLHWKDALRQDWLKPDAVGPELQRLRNQLGPEWLSKFQLP